MLESEGLDEHGQYSFTDPQITASGFSSASAAALQSDCSRSEMAMGAPRGPGGNCCQRRLASYAPCPTKYVVKLGTAASERLSPAAAAVLESLCMKNA